MSVLKYFKPRESRGSDGLMHPKGPLSSSIPSQAIALANREVERVGNSAEYRASSTQKKRAYSRKFAWQMAYDSSSFLDSYGVTILWVVGFSLAHQSLSRCRLPYILVYVVATNAAQFLALLPECFATATAVTTVPRTVQALARLASYRYRTRGQLARRLYVHVSIFRCKKNSAIGPPLRKFSNTIMFYMKNFLLKTFPNYGIVYKHFAFVCFDFHGAAPIRYVHASILKTWSTNVLLDSLTNG